MNDDLKKIKDKYGEKFMHLCRNLFPSIIEKGELFDLIESKFEYNKCLYDDIINNNLKTDFKNYIYSMCTKEKVEKTYTDKSVLELLNLKGYDLYECKSKEDIQSFRKYYAKDEELCTFKEENRLDKCYVFFAVKKNVDEIKREDFENPIREDLYGTSVISIQFTKDKNNTLSIKNRYNHRVINPDATFSNNLENIIPGLTCAFERDYNLNITQADSRDFGLLNYNYVNVNGKLYKYNYEINNLYYCPNNIIIDNNKVKKLDKSKYLLIDYFILDLQNKKIYLYDKKINDAFINTLIEIQNIKIFKNDNTKEIIIKTKFNEAIIKINKLNQMITYIDKKSILIGNNFLNNNLYLKSISMLSVEEIEDNFITYNEVIDNIKLPKVISIGSSFLYWNKLLKELDFPKLKYISELFMHKNLILSKINLPNLLVLKDYFLYNDKNLEYINAPKLKEFGNNDNLSNLNQKKLSLKLK